MDFNRTPANLRVDRRAIKELSDRNNIRKLLKNKELEFILRTDLKKEYEALLKKLKESQTAKLNARKKSRGNIRSTRAKERRDNFISSRGERRSGGDEEIRVLGESEEQQKKKIQETFLMLQQLRSLDRQVEQQPQDRTGIQLQLEFFNRALSGLEQRDRFFLENLNRLSAQNPGIIQPALAPPPQQQEEEESEDPILIPPQEEQQEESPKIVEQTPTPVSPKVTPRTREMNKQLARELNIPVKDAENLSDEDFINLLSTIQQPQQPQVSGGATGEEQDDFGIDEFLEEAKQSPPKPPTSIEQKQASPEVVDRLNQELLDTTRDGLSNLQRILDAANQPMSLEEKVEVFQAPQEERDLFFEQVEDPGRTPGLTPAREQELAEQTPRPPEIEFSNPLQETPTPVEEELAPEPAPVQTLEPEQEPEEEPAEEIAPFVELEVAEDTSEDQGSDEPAEPAEPAPEPATLPKPAKGKKKKTKKNNPLLQVQEGDLVDYKGGLAEVVDVQKQELPEGEVPEVTIKLAGGKERNVPGEKVKKNPEIAREQELNSILIGKYPDLVKQGLTTKSTKTGVRLKLQKENAKKIKKIVAQEDHGLIDEFYSLRNKRKDTEKKIKASKK